jgi:hypothetical protein
MVRGTNRHGEDDIRNGLRQFHCICRGARQVDWLLAEKNSFTWDSFLGSITVLHQLTCSDSLSTIVDSLDVNAQIFRRNSYKND